MDEKTEKFLKRCFNTEEWEFLQSKRFFQRLDGDAESLVRKAHDFLLEKNQDETKSIQIPKTPKYDI